MSHEYSVILLTHSIVPSRSHSMETWSLHVSRNSRMEKGDCEQWCRLDGVQRKPLQLNDQQFEPE